MPSLSSVVTNQIQVSPSYDVMGTHDPFDFLGFDVSITGDDCSSSCVYSIDDDSSSVSTIQHANTRIGRVNPSLSLNKIEGRVPLSLSTRFSGVGRVNSSFGLFLPPKMS